MCVCVFLSPPPPPQKPKKPTEASLAGSLTTLVNQFLSLTQERGSEKAPAVTMEAQPKLLRSLADVDEGILMEISRACDVPMGTIEDIYSCTPIQLAMIAETRDEVLHFVLSLRPGADVERFCSALSGVVELNSALRTRLVDCEALGGIFQVVTREEHVTERREDEDLEEYLRDDHIKPARSGGGGDGSSGARSFGVPLFRSALVGRSSLVLTMHHAIMDYWSVTMLLDVDVPAIGLGHSPVIRPAFKDFVAHYCMDVDETAAKSFWSSRFKGVPSVFPPTTVSPQRGRTTAQSPPPRPSVVGKEDRKVALKRVNDGSMPHNHLPFFIEAAWALTAATYADKASVAYGYVLSGRSPTPNAVETTLGPTITEVPVQVNLHRRTMTVEGLIKARAASVRQLQQHAGSGILHYGLDKIGALSEAAKIASGFQTLLNIRPALPTAGNTATTQGQEDADINFERLVWLGGSFPLQLVFSIVTDGVVIWPRTDSAVLGDRQLGRILDQFEHTLRLLTEVPPGTKLDDLQLLDPRARSDIHAWNKRAMFGPESAVEKCLHQVFRAQARARPEAIAVDSHDGSATYLSLDQVSDRLGHELRRRGVSCGTPVALIFEKSFWAIAAILGILKAGGTCVPIDKNDQYDDKRTMVSSAQVELVLTSAAEYAASVGLMASHSSVCAVSATSIAELPWVEDSGGSPGRNHDARATCSGAPKQPAYILFTNGTSTGPRKGVTLEHRSLATSLTAHAQRLGWGPGCRMLQFAAHASGNSILEIFGALLGGGCLCIPSDEEASGPQLPAFIRSARVDRAVLPPSTVRSMSPDEVPGLQSLLCTGEHADTRTSETWSRALRLFNGWGAREAAVLSTTVRVLPGSQQHAENIGTPAGCAVWIVNPQKTDELVPLGGVGELVVEGPVVARGYLNEEGFRATTSTPFFIPSSCPPRWASPPSHEEERKAPSRYFRTGDLARYNPDDNSISLIGRLSNRVRIGGSHTIQLEEVESAIACCEEVRDVVTAARISAGRTQLVALVCLSDHHQSPEKASQAGQRLCHGQDDLVDRRLDTVRECVRAWLPADEVPTFWLAVRQVPRTTSHKLDRAAVRELLRTLNR